MTASQSQNRQPPSAPDVERSILGSCMVDPAVIPMCIDAGCQATDFYRVANRYVFRAILQAFDASAGTDLPVIAEFLKREGVLQLVGDTAFLSELISESYTTINPEPLVRLLREYSARRRLIQAAAKVTEAAFTIDGDTGDIRDYAARLITEAADETRVDQARSFAELLPGALAKIAASFDATLPRPWLQTGFVDLDRKIGGLYPGDMIVVAGRPSMGKSAFALAVAMSVARAGKTVLVHSPEMNEQQILERAIATEARIDLGQMRAGTLPAVAQPKISIAAGPLAELPVWIDPTAGVTLQQIRSKVQRHSPALVVVDYLQLMTGDRSAGSREQEISGLSRGLKTLAKQFRVPVMVLSQLNREVERRRPPRPVLIDLRESGSIEQDTDVALLLYRPEYYNIDEDEAGSTKGRADVIIAKQRNGPTGQVSLTWSGPSTRFDNRAETEEDLPPPYYEK